MAIPRTTDISQQLAHLNGASARNWGFLYSTNAPRDIQPTVTLTKSGLDAKKLAQVAHALPALSRDSSQHQASSLRVVTRTLSLMMPQTDT